MAQTLMTMKRKLLMMALVCCSTVMFSQIRIDWQQCYGSMKDDDAVSLVAKDGGYYVVGRVEKGGGNGMVECGFIGDRRAWLIEIDSEGELQGQTCMEFDPTNVFGVMGEESTFYLVGDVREGENGVMKAGVVKMTDEGEILWQRSYGSTDQSFWYGPRATPTADGGLVFSLLICFSGGDIGQYYGFWDTWVVKLDRDGNIEWETTIGTEGEEICNEVVPCPDGTYCVPGYGRNMRGHGSVPNCNESFDYVDGLVVRLSAEGDITDSRCYGGSLHDAFNTAIPLDDGWLFGGSTKSEDGDLEGAGFHYGLNVNGYLTSDIWLMRTDADGNILWSRCYGGSDYEFVSRIFQNEDGGFTVFGRTDSHDGDAQSALNLYYPYYNDYRKLWVFRIDADGNLLWERVMGSATSSDEYLNDVIKLNDREYVIAGLVYCGYPQSGDVNCSNGVFFNGQDSGENYWVLHITDVFDYDGVEEPRPQENGVRVYPNPAIGQFTVSAERLKRLQLYDMLGQILVDVLSHNETSVMVDTRYLSPGVYLARIVTESGVVQKRVVVEK